MSETPADDSATGAPDAGGEAATKTTSPYRKWIVRGLQLAGTTIAFGYISTLVEPDDLGDAFGQIEVWAFVAACLISSINLCVGAVRWRILLAAYGAPHPPPLLELTRVYWIGFFFNNFVPGGIGGDVVRGVVTRAAFGDGGVGSVTVVLVERVLGLSGLLLLVSGVYVLRPLPGTEGVLPYSALGLLAAFGAVVAVAVGRRFARFAPGPIAKILASLPRIERWGPFAGALAMSLLTQTLVALTGWTLLYSVSGGTVSVADALVVVPLAMAAVFFPLTVGGAGARETAFIALCGVALAMDEPEALAASLLLWASQLLVAAFGGLAQLIRPVASRPADPPEPAPPQSF